MKHLKPLLALILIALALLLSAANAGAEGTNQRQPEPTSSLGAIQATQSAPPGALSALRDREVAAEKQSRHQYEPWYAPSVLAQFGLLIVGVVYTFFAWKQWAAIQEQARISHDTLIETKKSADAAKTSAEALIRTEWPRLLFEQFDAIGPVPEANLPNWPKVIVGFRNYGRTAAFVTEAFVAGRLLPFLPPDPDYWSPWPIRPVLAVAPNEKYACSQLLAGPLRREDISDILQGKVDYWVYGYVKCLDFRGDTHMTGFCARWRVKPDIWSHDGPPNYTYNYHGEGH